MARIPDYDAAGTSVARTQTPRFTDNSAQIERQGQAALLGAVGQVVQAAEEHDDKLNYAAARSSILKADADARESLRNDADPYTYEKRYRENLTKAKEGAAKQIRGRQSRALFEADIDADIERGVGQIREIARGRITDQGRATLQSTLDSSLKTALDAQDDASSIASIQTANTSITAAQERGYIDAVAAEKLRGGFRDSYAEGRITMAPLDKRIEMLANPKGTVAEALRGDRRTQLLERAREEKRIIDARAQALEDRREAKAERAVFQLEQQIASGVPLTDEMHQRWASTVKGTSFEAEFNQVTGSEKQVQSMLRQPIGEQLKFVQDREAQLLKGGGSQREIANFGRLKRAVEQNVKLIQQDPLLFLSRRTGEEFAPLDFNELAGGDPEQGALLDDRVTALRAARERIGTAVPVRPFLPQEAQALTAALQRASAKEQTELLTAMHQQFRDAEAFKGAMQQIAPDAPIKALAGVLAARQAELTTDTHWFGPDDTVPSATVAQTLLEGESILNPTASDKKEDGRPKLALFLPEDKLLQTEFTDAVGDAFRGNPQAADIAYQAVKAYYVGRAAQTGRVAASKEDVDTKLVRESVASVLGNVVDYNGAGSVIAPWGMSPDKFEDRAQVEFALAARRAGIAQDRISQLSGDIGLQNAGESRYAVTVGNNYLLDARGNPILIDLKDAKLR